MVTNQSVLLEGEHKMAVLGALITSDGSRVITASFDGAVLIWDRSTGKKIRTFTREVKPWYSLAISPDEQRLAAGTDGAVTVWDITSGREVLTFGGLDGQVYTLNFSAEGDSLVAATPAAISRWRAEAVVRE